jgi:hypothetical protein
MVTKTQFSSKSHHNIALVPLVLADKIMEPPDHTTTTKSGQQTVPPLTVADSAGKGKTSVEVELRTMNPMVGTDLAVKLLKHKKANMRKSEFLMLEALKSAPHLNDTLVMIDDNDTTNAYNIMLNYEPITNYTPHHELSPRRRCQDPLDCTRRSLHRHRCRRRPPSPSLSATALIVASMGLVVALCRLPRLSSSSLSVILILVF